MPSVPSTTSQRPLVLLLLVLLGCGFLATSLASYYAALDSIRDNIVNTELPLTSDNVYSEIQKDLVTPVLISSMMARDTFVRDWVMSGEQDVAQMTRYLREVQEHYGAVTSFFVSEQTHTYYQAKGVLKRVAAQEPRDSWYFRVRDMQEPYEINVDVDMANQDRLTVFINYKVFDYDQRFIGATGVGLTVDAVVKLIDDYQIRYDRSVYFVDTDGRIVLTGATGGPPGKTATAANRRLRVSGTRPRPLSQRALHSRAGLVPVRRQARNRGAGRHSPVAVPQPADLPGGHRHRPDPGQRCPAPLPDAHRRPGHHRSAHRVAQSPRLRPAGQPGDPGSAAQPQSTLRPAARPRQFQGSQRQPRPSGR